MADYIERTAAIQARCENLNPKNAYAKGWNACNSEFIDSIKKLPAADVTPAARGLWINFYGIYRCSECRKYIPDNTKWNFCPNCGADMREEVQDG